VAFLLSDLSGGGVQRMTLALVDGLVRRGAACRLVLCRAEGPLVDTLPVGLPVDVLQPRRTAAARVAIWRADPAGTLALARPVLLPWRTRKIFRYLPALAAQLRARPPAILVAATPPLNLMAVWARRLAGATTKLVLTERTAPSVMLRNEPVWHKRYLAPVMRRTYPRADAIVAVSDALARDLAAVVGLEPGGIRTIYNPVVGPEVAAGAAAPLDHSWFAAGTPPVILAVGRLGEQKDFHTLVRAFIELRRTREARLMILGEGGTPAEDARLRGELTELAAAAGVGGDLALPGFVANPFAYMARAALFVLSSRYEGLPGVLIQAMACGCPVVSTDCPTGPREILEEGRQGPLVPVGDVAAMARAMAVTLDQPPDRQSLRRRAAAFGKDRSVERYLALFRELGVRLAAPVACGTT
jgi:glycosyltransferase involved in cell wall biosynthesis